MTNIETLARDWLEAKRAEAEAAKRRYAIEAQMCDALDVPDEGSKTYKLDGYKVTVTQPVTRKLDEAIWQKVSALCPAEMHPIKVKIEADATGCKYLAQNEPAIWKKIARAFETKPGKVGFKVEEI
jgi:hypothetical protein